MCPAEASSRFTRKFATLPFNWRFTEVLGVAHDGCAMGKAAAGLWFGGALPSEKALGVGTGTVNA